MFLLERFSKARYQLHTYARKPLKHAVELKLVSRDGMRCMSYLHGSVHTKKKSLFLEINHRNGDPNYPDLETAKILSHAELDNLELWCELCHRKQGGYQKNHSARSIMGGVGRVSLLTPSGGGVILDEISREYVGEPRSFSGRANRISEPAFRDWLSVLMHNVAFGGLERPTLERIDNEGANRVSRSPKTTLKYRVKLVIPLGAVDDSRPYRTVRDLVSHRLVVEPKPVTVEAWKAEAPLSSEHNV